MFPMAFRSLAEAGPVAVRQRLKEGIELLLALIAPVTVWLAISADVVAGTLLGAEFQLSVATLLPLLAFGRMCGAINQFYLQVSFQLAGRPLLQVAHDIFILGSNIALLFVLTLTFGLPGTAVARSWGDIGDGVSHLRRQDRIFGTWSADVNERVGRRRRCLCRRSLPVRCRRRSHVGGFVSLAA